MSKKVSRKLTPEERRRKSLLSFAKIWNDQAYPTFFDLGRRLNKTVPQMQAQARRYRKACLTDRTLPELFLRKPGTGGVVPVPQSVLRSIDHFSFDTDKLKKAKGVVVTSAQFGAPLNRHFWQALKHYCDHRGLPLVVLPIKYGPIIARDGSYTSTFPDELKGHVIFDDVLLCNGNLNLNPFRMRPTLDSPLTDRVCRVGKKVSQIMAAPKLQLRHLPRVDRNHAKAIMTTGAVTHPNYQVDKLGQQDRTGELATEDHTYAAVVVEFEGKKTFHFRQLLANRRGEFYDISSHGGADFFSPNGVEHRPDGVRALVCGDWHTGITDPSVRSATFGRGSMTDCLKPKRVYLHDFMDDHSSSHWEDHQASRRAYKAWLQLSSLEKELDSLVRELNWMHEKTDAKLVVVASNHNEYVKEYIEEQRSHRNNDDINKVIVAELFLLIQYDLRQRSPKIHDIRPADPVVLYLRKFAPFVDALERQDKRFEVDILCSMHGDIGPGGKSTRSNKTFMKMNQRITGGHNHSSTIEDDIWRVGTSTRLIQHYVEGPGTNWTNTHQVIFENGQRQNVNIIKGKWRGSLKRTRSAK